MQLKTNEIKIYQMSSNTGYATCDTLYPRVQYFFIMLILVFILIKVKSYKRIMPI